MRLACIGRSTPAFERKRRGGHVPAAILLTQEAGPWHLDIVEEDLVEVMPTGHVDQRLDGDPGSFTLSRKWKCLCASARDQCGPA